MGGRDGNRGYLVQTLIALLQSLQLPDWTSVTIEPEHESEKVDILWETERYRRAVQVKSSINVFSVTSVGRWARELEANCSADEYFLLLVGPHSPGLARGKTFGKVKVPVPRNLALESMLSEATHLLSKFLSPKGLKFDSPEAGELLVRGLLTELSIMSSQSETWTHSEFVSKLTGWLYELSPNDITSTHDSVLSKSTRSFRVSRSKVVIGRDTERNWLRETPGDKLIVGPPGIGKTFLLREYVEEGRGLFLRSSNSEDIRRAISKLSPAAIVIENAHVYLDEIDLLRGIRAESPRHFDIVADCWPGGHNVVAERMGIRKSACLELKQVTDQQIVEIARDCIEQPTAPFLHMLVDQSNGFPGRAALLIEACIGEKNEDLESFWKGERLAQSIRSVLTDLMGKHAIRVLACFAIGGRTGITLELVGSTLQMSIAEVQQTVNELAMGGIVAVTTKNRIVVIPRMIRGVLVRDHFFGIAPISTEPFLEDWETLAATVETIIQARVVGASISFQELKKLAENANSLDVWRAFVHISGTHAGYVLEHKPELLSQLARDLLQVIPHQAITELLSLADGDERPLNSNTDHPLRKISDWAKSGYPGRDALKRRRLVLDAFLEAIENSEQFDHACKLLEIVVDIRYESVDQEPGESDQFCVRSSAGTITDLLQIAHFWPEILVAISKHRISDWRPLLAAIRCWFTTLLRSRGRVSEEQYSAIKSSAASILPPLAVMARGRPGILGALSEVAAIHDCELQFDISPNFETVFPQDVLADEINEARYEECKRDAQKLGELWSKREPKDVVTKAMQLIDESTFLEHTWPDFSAYVFEVISQNVSVQLPWIHAIMMANAPHNLLSPFLTNVLHSTKEDGNSVFYDCLRSQTYRAVAVQLALTDSLTPQHVLELAIENASGLRNVLCHIVSSHDLTDNIIIRLLSAQNQDTIRETLEGLCHKFKTPSTSQPWYSHWRQAMVTNLDHSYYLTDVFKNDPSLRLEWLKNYCRKPRTTWHSYYGEFDSYFENLSDDERVDLIDQITPDANGNFYLVKAIVGDSSYVYEYLLNKQHLTSFWTVPLQRWPDETWCEFAYLARTARISVAAIVDATREISGGYGAIPKKFHDEIEVWTSLLDTPKLSLRPIVSKALVAAQSELHDWEQMEREERF